MTPHSRLRVWTSCFARARETPGPLSIARLTPPWFRAEWPGREWKALAPSWRLVREAKDGIIDRVEYVRRYQSEVLDLLDTKEALRELEAFGPRLTLLCWEAPGVFCHRRLAAQWLASALGIDVPEWSAERTRQLTFDLEPPSRPGGAR